MASTFNGGSTELSFSFLQLLCGGDDADNHHFADSDGGGAVSFSSTPSYHQRYLNECNLESLPPQILSHLPSTIGELSASDFVDFYQNQVAVTGGVEVGSDELHSPKPELYGPAVIYDEVSSSSIEPSFNFMLHEPQLAAMNQLPNLRSLEIEPPRKVHRLNTPPSLDYSPDGYSLQTIVDSYKLSSYNVSSSASRQRRSPASVSESKKRRQRVSEKTHCLARLLPGDRRMNTVTMLEEAHKYIRFLQAQVSALQSMPIQSRFIETASGGGCHDIAVCSVLGRLSRQQLLEVLVNSPAAQLTMCTNGWCMVSAEQVAPMKTMEVQWRILQQLLYNQTI